MDTFKKIVLSQWRQFALVELDLDSNLTVLTGKNGSGKTTILNILSSHFGWTINLVSTPFLRKRDNINVWTDVWSVIKNDFSYTTEPIVGQISYLGGVVSNLMAPSYSAPQYNLTIPQMQGVYGLTIPSHRAASAYHTIGNIPTQPINSQAHFDQYRGILLSSYHNGGGPSNPGIVVKQSLISLAVFGYGNAAVRENTEYKILFETFQEILRKVLPKEIGFEKLEIRMPDVVLITRSGDFNLDAMSGGIGALLSIAWQIHMYGADKESCTIIIDEPENHLHPSMQREFLPNLKFAFPKFKFIVATHSPFIVASSPDATVYALTFNADSKVISVKLEQHDLSGSANKILREILDVPNTVPIWVEDRVKVVLQQYLQGEYNEENARAAFNALKDQGLNDALQDLTL